MKPFKNTILAIIIKDLQSVCNLLGYMYVFLGMLNYLGFISFNIDMSATGIEIAIYGVLFWSAAFVIEWGYHYLKQRYDQK